MAYPQFKIKDLAQTFGISVAKGDAFPGLSFADIAPSAWLNETLATSRRMALTSEKARSEQLVAPILMELLRRNDFSFSVLSGVNLDVDSVRGLNGECDFLVAAQPNLLDVNTPVLALVEAKDNDIDLGIPQCMAQMYGARLLNQQDGHATDTLWGCVTTGTDWQFLRLSGNNVVAHLDLIYLSQLPRLLAMLEYVILRGRE